ncbi:hypothetical protein BH780_gp088 [Bacillus phage Eldridge]|uniref:Uncharacterized protein n=1 Tax=Bacillus phage Eldridge TaxID=1776293 RepID=A0A109ZVR0_9CAUD|nr:hypothetical protein BH780_gp088 [Bacillus phage Eldridge]AMB18671.1 hypothetical protein Eldridge_091 [Bacillus phage Eldridge]
MPLERRDPHSKARLFIPTVREKSLVTSQRLLNQKINEVDKLKAELEQIIKDAKK